MIENLKQFLERYLINLIFIIILALFWVLLSATPV